MTWLDRVKIELSELQDRIEKLQCFLSSDRIQDISIHQLSLMSRQLTLMKQYEYILKERIKDGETE